MRGYKNKWTLWLLALCSSKAGEEDISTQGTGHSSLLAILTKVSAYSVLLKAVSTSLGALLSLSIIYKVRKPRICHSGLE